MADFWAVYHNGGLYPRLTAAGSLAVSPQSPIRRTGKTFWGWLPMRKNVSLEEKTRAIQLAVRENLREHALLGRSVSIWRDGQIVRLTPAEILEELRRTDPANGNGAAQDTHE